MVVGVDIAPETITVERLRRSYVATVTGNGGCGSLRDQSGRARAALLTLLNTKIKIGILFVARKQKNPNR